MSDNIEQQRKDLQDWITTKPAVDVSKQYDIERNKTTKPMAALRGLAGGLTSGFWPDIAAAGETAFGTMGDYNKAKAESEAAQEKAWQDQPGAYGTGYVPGTAVGLAAGPGVLAKGAALTGKAITKVAPVVEAVGNVVAPRATKIARTAADLGQGVAEGMGAAAKESEKFGKINQWLKGPANIKGIPLGSVENLLPRGAQVGSAAYHGWDSSNAERFGGGVDDMPSDEKRKAAMQMQSTPQGRSQTNSDSN